MKSLIILSLLLYAVLFPHTAHAESEEIRTNEAIVFFDHTAGTAAAMILEIYPGVKSDLAATLGLKVDFRPEIRLIKDKETMKRIAGNDLSVALAIPDRNLILLDTSRVYDKPFSLKTALRHEVCHLLLHRNIRKEDLPRWFDEGVCQWASGGIAEIMTDSGDDLLSKAIISGKLISIEGLDRFPSDRWSLLLAYEESKSFMEYIAEKYGKSEMLRLLEFLKKGHSMNESFREIFSVSPYELEINWQAYLKPKYTRFSYLSRNLYEILFSIAALLTVYGFFRMTKKKREYVDNEEDDVSNDKTGRE
jgi:hypothetical protein